MTVPCGSIFSPRFVSYRRLLLDRLLQQHVTLVVGRVIDVGGKKHRRRGDFDPSRVSRARWIVVNIDRTTRPDIVADAHRLPIREGTADYVVCCEVLEHVREPAVVCEELHRVLRAGGKAFISVPFLYPVHGDPQDYARFTPTKLEDLTARFRERHVIAMGGRMGTIAMLMELATRRTGGSFGSRVSRVLLRVVGRLGVFAELLVQGSGPGDITFATGFWCTASKGPDRGQGCRT